MLNLYTWKIIMTASSIKIIRKTAKSSPAGVSLLGSLASLTYKPRTDRYFKFRANPDNAFTTAFFNMAMEAQTVLSVSEYNDEVFAIFGYDVNNTKLRISYLTEINQMLANTPEGLILTINGRVARIAGVRKPKWYLNLTPVQQARVPVRTPADQVIDIGYNPSNLPAIVGASYDGVRGDYMALSSVGKRWRTPSKIAQVKRGDSNLGALAVNDAETREKMEAFAIALEKAQADTAAAQSELAALMSRNNEAIIAAQASAHAANSQTAAITALLTSPDKIIVPGASASNEDPNAAMFAKLMDAINQRFDAITASVAQAAPAPVAPARKRRRAATKAA